MWRFGYPNPVNYDDSELWCGGRTGKSCRDCLPGMLLMRSNCNYSRVPQFNMRLTEASAAFVEILGASKLLASMNSADSLRMVCWADVMHQVK